MLVVTRAVRLRGRRKESFDCIQDFCQLNLNIPVFAQFTAVQFVVSFPKTLYAEG